MRTSKFFQILLMLLLALFIWQCEGTLDSSNPMSDIYAKGGRGGGGNGGGGNGGGGGGGSTGGMDYGDLVICLRDANGIPNYQLITGEHGDEYFPLPIKFDELTGLPVFSEGAYQTFELNIEGEVIPETGFIVKEVEFGRSNLVRSPQRVLDSALQEALVSLTAPTVQRIMTDASGRLVAINGAEDWLVNTDDDPDNDEEDDKTIDSPRENLAIYQELMNRGFSGALAVLAGSFSNDPQTILNIAVGALAAGNDKTGHVIVDQIAYMNDWILDWTAIDGELGPDSKSRRYFNFADFDYDRAAVYGDKYVKITTLNNDGTWDEEFVCLLDAGIWSADEAFIDYSPVTEGSAGNITGFARAVDDAIQVLEFIHESDLIVYNPHYTAE